MEIFIHVLSEAVVLKHCIVSMQLKDPSKGVDAAKQTVDLVKKFKGEEVTESKLEDAKPEDPKRYDQVTCTTLSCVASSCMQET